MNNYNMGFGDITFKYLPDPHPRRFARLGTVIVVARGLLNTSGPRIRSTRTTIDIGRANRSDACGEICRACAFALARRPLWPIYLAGVRLSSNAPRRDRRRPIHEGVKHRRATYSGVME